MIAVNEHLESILSQLSPVQPRQVWAGGAVGLVLAEDVICPVDLPRFDNSAMDGYAVRAADIAEAEREAPVLIEVTGDIAAGDGEPHALVAGQAWRIMTGAPVPEGADTVVPFEATDEHPRTVAVREAVAEGKHIRRAGEDIRAGEVLLPAGRTVTPGALAALISAGVSQVSVIGPVRVAVLSTGDELRGEGGLGPGQIPDSNGPMIAAAVRVAGHQVVQVGHVGDVDKDVSRALKDLTGEVDAIITTGGVSKGVRDAVKSAMEGTLEFTQVAMQPGKPQGFGLLGRVPVFALPGNPVSALVSFEVFVAPGLAALADRGYAVRAHSAVVTRGWSSPEGKQQYTRVRVTRDAGGGLAATPVGGPGSHLVSGLGLADALAVTAPEVTEVSTGEQVPVRLLRPMPEIEAAYERDEQHR